MLLLSLILVPLFGTLLYLFILIGFFKSTPQKRFIYILCFILTFLFFLYLIFLTICTGDGVLSISFFNVIIEMVKEIPYNDNNHYFIGQGFPDPFSNPSPSEAPSEATSGASIPSTVLPDPIPCPCCEATEGGRCNCFGWETHLLDPPYEGMNAELPGHIDRVCCICGNAFDLRPCFDCQCVICDGCQTACHPIHPEQKG